MKNAASKLARTLSSLRKKLRAIPSKSCLVAIVIGYALLVVWYFAISSAAILKYAITIGGILLGTVVREAARKEWRILRLIAICVPVVAVAVVQANDTYKASLATQGKQLEETRDRARDLEAKLREELVLDPRDTIESIRNADRGFVAKADGLALRGNLKATRLASLFPTVATALSKLPPDPDAQIQAYQSLLKMRRPASDDRTAYDKLIAEIIRLLKLQISYRNAASDFRIEVKPVYEGMLSLNERSADGEREFRARLATAAERVAKSAARYRIAGLYNHAGQLAMASRQNERALAWFYQALAVEQEHVPAYESLGYALWIINLDAYGALHMSSIGLEECERLRVELDAGDRTSAFRKHVDGMTARLKLQYAYFSALQFENEKTARVYAKELVASKTSDAEYQDVSGYVRMRFAKDSEEVEESIKLFRQAIENPEAERITKRLASAHLQQATDLLNRLKRR